jgi:kinetochor protein Mis14/NSL1
MTEFHRKIELQSSEDLQYLVSNIRRAANEKIDKDWPPIEEEDTMRKRVEELVHDVCNPSLLQKHSTVGINKIMRE